MSYTKLQDQMPYVADALDSLLRRESIDNPILHDRLLESGLTVQLTSDGQHVWVACLPDDNPATHLVEFFAVAIAGDDQTPEFRSNGHVIGEVFTRSVDPGLVATRGVDIIRKEMMQVILGLEPDDVENSGLTAEQRAQRNIRTKLTVNAGITTSPVDVL